MKELPPYSKNKKKCPKCGHKDVSTIYCLGKTSACVIWIDLDKQTEHLERTCQQCHYQWAEQCIKQKG